MEFSREDIPFFTAPSGHELTFPIFRYRGQPGPKVYIQASLHGAEVQGNAVIAEFMRYMDQVKNFYGEILLVPMVNPLGTNNKVGSATAGRYDPSLGDNWNRMYYYCTGKRKHEHSPEIDINSLLPSLVDKEPEEIKKIFRSHLKGSLEARRKEIEEYGAPISKQLCLAIQELSYDADIVLDLHTATRACRYLYAGNFQREDAKYFKIPYVISIPHDFAGALDEANFSPWCDLADALKKKNVDFKVPINSFTIELGSEEVVNFEEAKTDLQYLKNFLIHKGVLNEKPGLEENRVYWSELKNFKAYYAPQGALYQFEKKPGEHFIPGETLATGLLFTQIQGASDLPKLNFKLESRAKGAVIFNDTSSICPQGALLVQTLENLKEY